MAGTRAGQRGPARHALGSRPRGVVWTVVLCAAMLLGGCNTPTTPGATAAPGPTVVAHGASVALAPPFDPSAGAPLPYNRIISAYGIVGGVDFNGPASNPVSLENYIPQMQQLGKQYEALDPAHPVKLGIDIVVNGIQPCYPVFAPYCTSWVDAHKPSNPCDASTQFCTLDQIVSFCQQHDLLLFFDLQLFTEPVEHALMNHLMPYLEGYSFTELALDTEFHFPDTPQGRADAAGYPCCLGWMDASEINRTIDELAQISLQQHLPRKILVVHEWNSNVLPDKEKIKLNPNVSIVLHSDGFGGFDNKIGDYQVFVKQELIQYGGYKIFLPYADGGAPDVDYQGRHLAQTPQQVMQLYPQPLIISYQ